MQPVLDESEILIAARSEGSARQVLGRWRSWGRWAILGTIVAKLLVVSSLIVGAPFSFMALLHRRAHVAGSKVELGFGRPEPCSLTTLYNCGAGAERAPEQRNASDARRRARGAAADPTAARHEAEAEEAGSDVWEVVYSGTVPVREKPYDSAKRLGVKWKCARVRARQLGYWLQMVDEPGYISMRSTEGFLLRQHKEGRECVGCSEIESNCIKSHCCRTKGMQCYEKNARFASCKYSCEPGPDLTDVDGDPWTCRKLGRRTPGDRAASKVVVPVARWVATKCAAPGDDCSTSKCCSWEGMRCYEKNRFWGSCKASCIAGPDPTDINGRHWSCRPLGPRTPGKLAKAKLIRDVADWVEEDCSVPGANCAVTKCCAWPGMQCFEKHGSWASCKPYCRAGPDPTDLDPHHWSCRPLGPRTPGKLAKEKLLMKVAAWVESECSAPGTDCRHSKCCNQAGFQCFEKNPRWASCKTRCVRGVHRANNDTSPWSCRKIGHLTPQLDVHASGETLWAEPTRRQVA